MSSPGCVTVAIGTYPAEGQGAATGQGEGVWTAELDLRSGRLDGARQVAELAAPSFLAADPLSGLIYAVGESTDGQLSALRLSPAGAVVVSTVRTLGADPCHLVVDRSLSAVVVAQYSSGAVAVIRLDPEGVPVGEAAEQVFPLQGSGPDDVRQAEAHAHYVLITPDGRHVLVVDLGADMIRRFVRDAKRRRLVEDGIAVALPAGAGPRHAVFARDGRHLYVIGELDGRLHTVVWDARTATGRVVAAAPADPTARWDTALAHVTLRGDTLHVGVRGSNALAVHALGDQGRPRFVAVLPLPGVWPRHHTEIGRWTLVAQQHAGGVVVLDPTGRMVGGVEVPSPACVLPISSGHRAGVVHR